MNAAITKTAEAAIGNSDKLAATCLVAGSYIIGKITERLANAPSKHNALSSDNSDSGPAPRSRKAESITPTAAKPPPDDDQDCESDAEIPEELKQKIKKGLEEIIGGEEGKEFYEKLKERAAANDEGGGNRTVGKSDDFRIDVGHHDKEKGVRHWHFQVNDEASKPAKKLLKKAARPGQDPTTHIKLFRGKLNYRNPPTYSDWVDTIWRRLK